MSRSRSRVAAVAAALLFTSLGSSAVTIAADSPEGAIDELLEIARSRDLSTIDQVVCADKRDTARQVLDLAAEMDLAADPTLLDDLSIELSDVAIAITSDDGQTAEATVTGTLTMSYPEDQVEALVRASLGEDADPDELGFVLPLMRSMLNGSLPVDEEVTVVLEEGEWLVCGGFGLDRPQLPGTAPSVSGEGLCGLVSPDALPPLGDVVFDSSNGFSSGSDTFCNYFTSDFESFESVGVTISLDGDAESQGSFLGLDQPLEVAGAPAWSSGPQAFVDAIYVQAGPDVLQIMVTPPEPAPDDWDWLPYAIEVAELFVPVAADVRAQYEASLPEPTPEPTPEPSLCELLPLDAANEAFGLGFDEASGDRYYCSYDQLDGEPGWHYLQVSLVETSLDEVRTWMTGGEDTTVADLPARRDASLLIIELPGGAWTLQLSGWVDENDPEATLTLQELEDTVASTYVPLIDIPEPTRLDGFGADDFGLDDFGAPTLPSPICDYVDLEAVNALGPLAYDDATSAFPDYCTLSQSDPGQGFHQTTIFVSPFGLDDLGSFVPDATDLTIAGNPALLTPSDLHVQLPDVVLTFNSIVFDPGATDEVATSDVLVSLAELVVAAIEAEAGE